MTPRKSGAHRGRPKGTANIKTRAIAEAALAGGITPLEYMLEVLRDASNELAVRLDAAKSAAPYIHPRLSAVDARVSFSPHDEWVKGASAALGIDPGEVSAGLAGLRGDVPENPDEVGDDPATAPESRAAIRS